MVLVCSALQTQANAVRAQVVEIKQGWNSVFLEVTPEDKSPEAFFANTPVNIAAAPLTTGQSAQYSSDPSVNRLHMEGWACWYSKDNPQSFLSTLFAIQGNQAYLLHSSESFVLTVTGTVQHRPIKWQPDRFNMVGFSVMNPAAPTFAQFFQGSVAHRGKPIYRLVSGSWRKVVDPSAAVMRSGEAFWMFCDGTSGYQGPLRVVPNSLDGMLLSSEPGTLELYNDSSYPISMTVEHLVGETAPPPLSIIVQTVHAEEPQFRSQAVAQPAADWIIELPPMEAGRSRGIPLQARLEDMSLAVQRSLLRVTTDIGTELWIPVECIRKDLVQE
jgi:hypothetical protein